jgi:hypothetical protein
MPIVPYAAEQHGRWVFSSWCAGSGEPWEALEQHLEKGARLLVYTGQDPDLFVGWACALAPPACQHVVWCYTRSTPAGVARGRGVMRALLAELGVDTDKPMVALFDSPACQGLRRKGWPITVKGSHERPAAETGSQAEG